MSIVIYMQCCVCKSVRFSEPGFNKMFYTPDYIGHNVPMAELQKVPLCMAQPLE